MHNMTEENTFLSGQDISRNGAAIVECQNSGTVVCGHGEDPGTVVCSHSEDSGTVACGHVGSVIQLKKKKHSKTKDERLYNMKRATAQQLKIVDRTMFIETRAYKKAKAKLQNLGIVVLVGSQGSGKTTLGVNLLSVTGALDKRQLLFMTHHTQFETLPIPKNLHKIKDEEKWVIMIDDIFGRSNLVSEFRSSWELKFPTLWRLSEVGLIKVIITFRSQIFHECRTHLSDFAVFQDNHSVDLHAADHSLTTDEKLNILNQHLNNSRVTMSEDDKNLAVSLVFTELGFPQCCQYYVNSPVAQQRGVDYFRKPIEYLRGQLDKLKSEDQSQFEYLVLLTVMFKQGVLPESCLDPFAEDADTMNLIRTLKGVCRINTDVSPGQVKSSAKSLCGLYLAYSAERKQYSFIHQSVFDTLFLQFSADFLQQSIKICPLSMLLEYVVTPGAPLKGDITVTVHEESYHVLAQRFTDLLKSDSARWILSHQSFNDEQFVEFLIKDFWNCGTPCEILFGKLEPEFYDIPIVFHKYNLHELWDQFEYSEDLSNFSFYFLTTYGPLSTDFVVTSSPASVAVMEKLNTLSRHLVSCLCQINFTMLDDQKHEQKHDQKQEKQEQKLKHYQKQEKLKEQKEQDVKQEQVQTPDQEILNIASYVGNAEVVDMLLTFGTTPTLQTFKSAAISETDNVMILENIFNSKNDLQLSVDDLGSMLFLAMENGNGNISHLLIDKLNSLENNQGILERAFKQLLLQCHTHIQKKILDRYLSKHITTGTATLFDKLSRFAASCKPNVVMFLAAGHNESGVLKEIFKINPDCLESKENKLILHTSACYGCLDSVTLLVDRGCDVSKVNKDKQTPLHLAAKYNTADVMLYLLGKGADPNATDADNSSPLRLALQHGVLDSVKALVENGAHLKAMDASGQSPLHVAARCCSVECVKYLLEKGSHINMLDHNDMAPLHLAAQYGNPAVSLYLLKQGADPYIKDVSKLLLHSAVHEDSIELAELLVEKKLDIETKDRHGNTALHKAVDQNYLHLVKFLVGKGSNVNLPNELGLTPLHIATACQTPEVGLYLLTKGADANLLDSDKISPLHLAVSLAGLEMTKALVEKGGNLNAVDKHGNTPLHNAMQAVVNCKVGGETRINSGIGGGNISVCVYLLRHGADHNATDSDKNSPLHLAVLADSLYLAQTLVENKATVNAVGKDGKTPLHIAVHGSSLKFVTYLVENGAQINVPDVNGMMPLHIAALGSKSDVGVYLLNKGADTNATDAEHRSPLHLALQANCSLSQSLLEKDARVDILDSSGNIFLHIAAEYSSLQIVRQLVERGSQLNVPNTKGMMPLHLAAKNNTSDVGVYLVNKGANPNVRDSDNNTPLHLAVRANNLQLVHALVEKGVDMNTKNDSGQTVLDTAAQYGSVDIVSYLLQNSPCLDSSCGNTLLLLAAEHNTSHVCLCLVDKVITHSLQSDASSLLCLAAQKSDTDLVKALVKAGLSLNASDGAGNTPLHIAIENNCVELVNFLVEEQCDINIQNNMGITPLCSAVSHNNANLSVYLLSNGTDANLVSQKRISIPLHLAVDKCMLNVVQALVEHGADVNAVDELGNTALHIAVEADLSECVEYLMEHGSEINSRNKRGKTPLYQAVLYGFEDLAFLLLSKGADTTIPDCYRVGPLNLALACSTASLKLLKAFVEKGASVNMLTWGNDTPLHYAIKRDSLLESITYLVDQGAEVNIQNTEGKTPLHLSAIYCRVGLLSYLLSKGANPDISDQHMLTPLLSAVDKSSFDCMKALIDRGADINMVDVQGNSPLHVAVKNNSTECVIYLVEHECQVNMINKNGLSPLHLAMRRAEMEIALYLLGNGADPNVMEEEHLHLHYAIQADSLDVMRELVNSGAKLNGEDSAGNSLLHSASPRSSWQVVRYLIDHGLNVNKANSNGITALHLAVSGLRSPTKASVGYKVIALLLEAGSDVNAEDEKGYTPLIYACSSGDLKNVELLVGKDADPNHGNITAMHAAAGFHLINILQFFLSKGGNAKAVSKAENTLLHVAVRLNVLDRIFTQSYPAVIEGRISFLLWRNCIDYLIGDCHLETPDLSCAEVSMDSDDEFALILSRFERKAETGNIVDMLVGNGCCIDGRNTRGQTPLHVCVEYHQSDNLKMLLEKGADVAVLDTKGNSVLHDAVLSSQVDVVQMLLDAGAVDVQNADGASAADVARSKLEDCDDEDVKEK